MGCPEPAAGVRLALAAEALVGVPFRLHGRDVGSGLDCVGLIGAALAGAGIAAGARPMPTGYTLRMMEIDGWLADAAGWGFAVVAGEGDIWPGDVLLLVAGPAQFHFAVADRGGGIVHADAGLRRVVQSVLPPWPRRGQWRLGI